MKVLRIFGILLLSAASLIASASEKMTQRYLDALSSGDAVALSDILSPSAKKEFRFVIAAVLPFSKQTDAKAKLRQEIFGKEDIRLLTDGEFVRKALTAMLVPQKDNAKASLTVIGSVYDDDIYYVVCKDMSDEGTRAFLVRVKSFGNDRGVLMNDTLHEIARALSKEI